MTTPVGPPPTGPAPIDPDERPREVETAFRLFVADIVLGVLGLLSMLAFLPRLTRAVEQQQRVSGAAGGVDPVSLATVVVTVFVGVGLGLAAFRLFVVFRMRAGRNWARVLLLVLSAAQLAVIVYQSNEATGEFSTGIVGLFSAIAGLASLVLLLVATSYLFRPDAIRFFRARRA